MALDLEAYGFTKIHEAEWSIESKGEEEKGFKIRPPLPKDFETYRKPKITIHKFDNDYMIRTPRYIYASMDETELIEWLHFRGHLEQK